MIFNVVMSLSMIRNNAQPTPHRRTWKLIPPPLNLEIIEEQGDCGYLVLGTGTETPTPSFFNFLQMPAHVDNWPQPIWLRLEDCLRLSIIRGDVIVDDIAGSGTSMYSFS